MARREFFRRGARRGRPVRLDRASARASMRVYTFRWCGSCVHFSPVGGRSWGDPDFPRVGVCGATTPGQPIEWPGLGRAMATEPKCPDHRSPPVAAVELPQAGAAAVCCLWCGRRGEPLPSLELTGHGGARCELCGLVFDLADPSASAGQTYGNCTCFDTTDELALRPYPFRCLYAGTAACLFPWSQFVAVGGLEVRDGGSSGGGSGVTEPRYGITIAVYADGAAAQRDVARWRDMTDDYWRNRGLPVRRDWEFAVEQWKWEGAHGRWYVVARPPRRTP